MPHTTMLMIRFFMACIMFPIFSLCHKNQPVKKWICQLAVRSWCWWKQRKMWSLKKLKQRPKKCSFHYFQIMRQNKWLEIQNSIKKGGKENKPIREYYK